MRRLSFMSPTQSTWFVNTIAVTALVVLFCGQQAGLGGDSAAADPLTLSLNAPRTCETEPAVRFASGWHVSGEVEVAWSVSGGTAPYTLTIDGEAMGFARADQAAEMTPAFVDGHERTTKHTPYDYDRRPDEEIREWLLVEEYRGASGAVLASCALSHTGFALTSLERRYQEEPEVDSGWKTVRATVTDAEGSTAEASVDVYVILEIWAGGTLLEEGKTYRVSNTLLTVPQGVDLEMGGYVLGDGGASGFDLFVAGTNAWIFLEASRFGARDGGRSIPSDEVGGTSEGQLDFDAIFDDLVASIGQLPSSPTEANSE